MLKKIAPVVLACSLFIVPVNASLKNKFLTVGRFGLGCLCSVAAFKYYKSGQKVQRTYFPNGNVQSILYYTDWKNRIGGAILLCAAGLLFSFNWIKKKKKA